ncbi:DUF3080 family protein [Vreelandella subglaciescola]|uniref:DUF3080 domain-containing protein n=1 Tax=Vreelandella subglaciescola TaxID=29571 RepID=A0A1M7IRF1_9GAMM|nr:DUF3080 family protein [Halomonas subglaciescola]SHM43291.1 Protein of unknown function [Halomonas subglaciescola]
MSSTWRSGRKILAFTACLTGGLLLSGCGDSDAERYWQDYHRTLESALALDAIPRRAPDNIGAFPERRARLFDLPEVREGLIGIYALRECRITALVAAHNNQLGRVAPPSQQWLYQRALWQRLSGCWNTPVPDGLATVDRQRLHRLTLTKTQQLPYASWNALFDSSEWEKSFARASHPVDFTRVDIRPALGAVNYLQRMVRHQFSRSWEQDSGTLEHQLKILRKRPLTAQTLRTLMLATQRLREATATLNTTTPTRCLPAWDMGYIAATRHSARRWLTAVNALFDSVPVTPPNAMHTYRQRWLSLDNQRAPWSAFKTALVEHHSARFRFPACRR